MREGRLVSLFRSGRHQVIHSPRDMELDADEVVIRREGATLVIEPVTRSGLVDWLTTLTPLDVVAPEMDDPPAEDEPVILE